MARGSGATTVFPGNVIHTEPGSRRPLSLSDSHASHAMRPIDSLKPALLTSEGGCVPSVARVGARCTTEPVFFSHARRRPRRCRMGLGSLTYVGPGENVFLFIPNLIGYLRVVSLLLPPATSHRAAGRQHAPCL